MEKAHGDTFIGYDLAEDGFFRIIIHDADTKEISHTATFGDDGLARVFMGATPGLGCEGGTCRRS